MKILAEHPGKVEAEIIALIMREPFDYTKWQNLWPDKTVKQISEAAMNYRKHSLV